MSWIDNAATIWNRANTGWTFQKCTHRRRMTRYTFSFNRGATKLQAGAAGRSLRRAGRRLLEDHDRANVAGMKINNVRIVGGR